MRRWIPVVLGLSLALNLFLAGLVVYQILMGRPESARGELRRLARDIEVGRFNETSTVFTLPKGLLVRDASASGIDWFEPHRFRIVITSDDPGLLESVGTSATDRELNSEYYSADVVLRRQQEAEVGSK